MRLTRVSSVDALMVGASDLRCAPGIEVDSQDGGDSSFLDALETIQRAADRNGLASLGFAMTPEILERRMKRGWRAFVVHSEGSAIFNSRMKSFQDNVKSSRLHALSASA